MNDNSIVSIIIATKNRQTILNETLFKALNAIEDYPIEIIVINDGDNLNNTITHPKIQYLNNSKKGVSTARNLGASTAKSDILLFLDDDMWISKETIKAIEIIKNKIDLNNNVICLNWEYPEILEQQLNLSKIGRLILNAEYHTMKGRINRNLLWNNTFEKIEGIGSCSFLIKKDTFNEIGKYNESIVFQGEDIDISKRLIEYKITIFAYTPITCYHNHQDRIDIEGYIDREFRGYASQAIAEKNQLIDNQFKDRFSIKNKIYKALLPLDFFFIFMYKIIPNTKYFDIISFKIIGILGAMQKLKAYK